MSERGFSLLEGMVALAILGVVLAGIVPAFFNFMDANTRNERRTGAIAAAQERMETVRGEDPQSMPSSGSAGPIFIDVDGLEFEVLTTYCAVPAYCNTDTRHVTIEVSFGGQKLYQTETVYTRLR